jgi:hypothetical protein
MRKLILRQNMSVDGFVGGPNGEIDWIFKSFDAGATAWTMETRGRPVCTSSAAARSDMAAYWPTSTEPYATPMNGFRKSSFPGAGGFRPRPRRRSPMRDGSRTEEAASAAALSSWSNAEIASGDLASEIRA